MEVLISGQIQSTDYFASFVETVHRCCRSASKAAEVFHARSLFPKERMVGRKTGIRIRCRIRVTESGNLPTLVDQTWKASGPPKVPMSCIPSSSSQTKARVSVAFGGQIWNGKQYRNW